MIRIRLTRVLAGAAALGLAATALTLLAGPAPARSAGAPSDSPKAQRLRETELTRMRALVEADMAVVRALHADDFQLVPPPGFPLSRAEYLGAVAAGDIDYLAFEPISEIDVRLYGQAAVMRYESNIDVVVSGLGRFTHAAWHTYVYEKRHGRWQVVWEQATAVGGFPPPAG